MDHNNNTDIFKQLDISLTEDEQKILEKLNTAIVRKMQERKKSVFENADQVMADKNLLIDDPIKSRHITDYDREIFVSLRMEISSTNTEGQIIELGQILESFYHIPVPSGTDYYESMQKFINKFDNELTDCAKKMHKNEQSNK